MLNTWCLSIRPWPRRVDQEERIVPSVLYFRESLLLHQNVSVGFGYNSSHLSRVSCLPELKRNEFILLLNSATFNEKIVIEMESGTIYLPESFLLLVEENSDHLSRGPE
jgi:hypothetical protein